jgi:hypothetical protein
MTRRLSIIAAGIIAVCALPASAASDPHAKKAAADTLAAKRVAAGPHAPKTTAATEPQAAKNAATAEANVPSKSAGADAHSSAKAAAATRNQGLPAAKGDRATAGPVTLAADPHAVGPAASPHAGEKPSATAAQRSAHSPVHSAPAADADKLPIATDLRALNDRIQARLAEVRKGQVSRPSPRSKAAGSRHTPAPASTPRIELVWRPSVTWPQDLYGNAAATAPQMPLAADRASVARGPQP